MLILLADIRNFLDQTSLRKHATLNYQQKRLFFKNEVKNYHFVFDTMKNNKLFSRVFRIGKKRGKKTFFHLNNKNHKSNNINSIFLENHLIKITNLFGEIIYENSKIDQSLDGKEEEKIEENKKKIKIKTKKR